MAAAAPSSHLRATTVVDINVTPSRICMRQTIRRRRPCGVRRRTLSPRLRRGQIRFLFGSMSFHCFRGNGAPLHRSIQADVSGIAAAAVVSPWCTLDGRMDHVGRMLEIERNRSMFGRIGRTRRDLAPLKSSSPPSVIGTPTEQSIIDDWLNDGLDWSPADAYIVSICGSADGLQREHRCGKSSDGTDTLIYIPTKT